MTEHQVQERACTCGTVTAAAFPPEATASTCYGPRISAIATYLMARHHVPVARTAELMADCFAAPVSTGWLAGLPRCAAAGLEPFNTATIEGLRNAPVAHFDETGARVAGQLSWVHVASNAHLTRLHLAPGRGRDSIGVGQILGAGFAGIAVHDCLNAYNSYHVTHALCCAHILRELTAVFQSTGEEWAEQLADLLVETLTAVNQAKAGGRDRLGARKLSGYRRRYQALVATGITHHPAPPPTGKQGRPKLGYIGSLLRRLDIYQDDFLRFATDFTVPFDNNQAERDVRMVGLQQKISGCWRSRHGAQAFLDIRSYLATAIKNSKNSLDALTELFTTGPWIPTPTGHSP